MLGVKDSDDSGNSNIKLNLIEGRSLVRKVNGIPEIYICGSLQASIWVVAIKLSPISTELVLKVK